MGRRHTGRRPGRAARVGREKEQPELVGEGAEPGETPAPASTGAVQRDHQWRRRSGCVRRGNVEHPVAIGAAQLEGDFAGGRSVRGGSMRAAAQPAATVLPSPLLGGECRGTAGRARAARRGERGGQARAGEPQQITAMNGGTHLRHRTDPSAPEMQPMGSTPSGLALELVDAFAGTERKLNPAMGDVVNVTENYLIPSRREGPARAGKVPRFARDEGRVIGMKEGDQLRTRIPLPQRPAPP